MTCTPIGDPDDPRLAPYRCLKDRDLAAHGDRFIVESETVVRRLIDAGLSIDSILIAERRFEKMRDALPAGVDALIIRDALMEKVIGFRFHSGVLACAFRPAALSVPHLIAQCGVHATLMVLPDTNNTENLGLLMRIAAGFGVDGLLLGPTCCDPYYRQAVRVSMGSVFKLRIARCDDLLNDFKLLQEAQFELLATVLDSTAHSLHAFARSCRSAILFGNEAQGLSEEIVAACNHRLTLPMQLGTDSLNVAVAAGIFMYGLQR